MAEPEAFGSDGESGRRERGTLGAKEGAGGPAAGASGRRRGWWKGLTKPAGPREPPPRWCIPGVPREVPTCHHRALKRARGLAAAAYGTSSCNVTVEMAVCWPASCFIHGLIHSRGGRVGAGRSVQRVPCRGTRRGYLCDGDDTWVGWGADPATPSKSTMCASRPTSRSVMTELLEAAQRAAATRVDGRRLVAASSVLARPSSVPSLAATKGTAVRGPRRRKRSFFSSRAYGGHDARAKVWSWASGRHCAGGTTTSYNRTWMYTPNMLHTVTDTVTHPLPTLFSCFRAYWFRFAPGAATIRRSAARPCRHLRRMSTHRAHRACIARERGRRDGIELTGGDQWGPPKRPRPRRL